jgi:hypothetical protein
MTTIQAGNTVTLSCNFTNFDGLVEDPQLVKLKFYDHRSEVIEEIVLGSANRIDTGQYKYYYTTPTTKNQKITYEWYAEYAGKPILKRDSFLVTFM